MQLLLTFLWPHSKSIHSLAFGLVVIANEPLELTCETVYDRDGKHKKYFLYNLLTTVRAGIAQSV
jgi:hypothetical protein